MTQLLLMFQGAVRACGLFPVSRHRVISRNAASALSRAAPAVALSCLRVSRNCWCPRNTGTRPQLLRIPLSLSLPPRAPGLHSRASTRNNRGPLAPDFARSGSHDDGTPPPCQHDNCPCCPTVHAAAGILPTETTRVAYAPRLSEAVAPPARLGTFTRFAAFAGQPPTPPILI